MLVCTAASAQTTYTDKEGNVYTFQRHWFLDVQGGAQYTLGEASFGDLISPNIQLGVGYQFNHWLGARFQLNAWQSKGGFNGVDELGNYAPLTTNYKWNYVAPGVEALFNLTNIIWGYNPNRVVDVNAFAGGGLNIAWGNDEANTIAKNATMRYIWDGTKTRPFGRAGLQVGFNVSKAVSLMIEGNANILSDKYNSKKASSPDWYFNLLGGIRINLGKTYTKAAPPPPAPEPEPVVQEKPIVEEHHAPVVEEKKIEPLRRDVFFSINKSDVAPAEQQKITDIVNYLNENPDTKVAVTGYADSGTGNSTINAKIARLRADAVTKALSAAGIAADRITTESKGDTVQPFSENDLNRVTIIIAQ